MDSLRKKWIAYKAQLTIFIKKIDKENYSVEIAEEGLTTHKERIQKLFEEMIDHTNHDDIESLTEEHSTELDRIIKAQESLQRNNKGNKECSSGINDQITNIGHLPELRLPTFSGQPTEWATFADLFGATVHNRSFLTDAQKMQYLKLALQGGACDVIKHMPVTEGNYQQAWELLRCRYENKRLIANTYAQNMIAFPNIREGHSLRELLDCFHKNDKALRTFVPEADLWGLIVSNLILVHLDDETLNAWELSLQTTDVPSLEQLINFLEVRARAQELRKPVTTNPQRTKNKESKSSPQCPECKGDHRLWSCPKFNQLEVSARWERVRKLDLCSNCLSTNHYSAQCKASKCKKCQKSHHSLLHKERAQATPGLTTCITNEVLMPTAIMDIEGKKGRRHRIKVLLDTGSQTNVITKDLVHKLQLTTRTRRKEVQTVLGICQLPKETTITLSKGNWQRNITCYISDQLNIKLPAQPIRKTWQHLQDLELADPQFWKPQGVELILGVQITSQLWMEGLRRGRESEPIAQNSILGWLISGPTAIQAQKQLASFLTCEVKDELRRFWEVEEIPQQQIRSTEENHAEKIYQETTIKTVDHRYQVNYPFWEEPLSLGDSKEQAVSRLLQLEKTLSKTKKREEYAQVLKEYLELGHMTLVKNPRDTNSACYLPHHAVFKESSTTKLRVVFDASAKTTNGKSLNDVMLNGPKMQEDLFHILIRFQSHAIALCADIEKMYRQIRINPAHQKYQRILWRNETHEPIQEFELTTVTFGMKAAPFLATRTLQQLAEDEGEAYPRAAEALRRDFYVDDLLSGAHSVEAARELQEQLSTLCQSAGFKLRKWCSNNKEAISGIRTSSGDNKMIIQADEPVTTLGLTWDPLKDTFGFSVNLPSRRRHSRRTLLSDTSKIFDPLGWLSPIIIRAKMMFQALWCQSLTWDQELPADICKAWSQLRRDLECIQNIEIPRYIPFEEPANITLCGFCDASQKAYGAVLYLRSECDGVRKTKLLTAKSRVTPLRPLSIPRLELCAAVLLSRLVKETKAAMRVNLETMLWSDSEIVLHWISQHPSKWKMFVANRVMEIQENTGAGCTWNHVDSKDNPADLISRGIDAHDLRTTTLWWNGPPWLRHATIPRKGCSQPKKVLEARKITHIFVTTVQEPFVTRYSSLDKLLRVTAWILRFANRALKRDAHATKNVSIQELRNALRIIIRMIQQEVYPKEIQALQKGGLVDPKSPVSSLAPFLDKQGIVRVGGRIRNAKLGFDQKHQILLPSSHHVTTLIVNDMHLKNLHAGPQLLLNTIRQKYWIPKGKNVTRNHTRRCATCVRHQSCLRKQIMGDLPSTRVTPSRPFLKCGVDYCGPILCREMIGRTRRIHKAYVAVFVCMATKAVHMEVVSSLNMDCFLAALNRFVARRGVPTDIYSDNGRNFTAAHRHLKDLYQMLADQTNEDQLCSNLATKSITWHFIPPYSPHFGGLWEAAIKSLKYHLRRVCGPNTFTFEELTTIITRIEACLNSRPISPLSEDVNDIEPLTPGHFLIGESLNTIPEEVVEAPISRLSRYRLLQRVTQDIWRRWHRDYLTTLQQRTKWQTQEPNKFNCGDLVIIKDPNSLPQSWKLGRITAIMPDPGGTTRVVTINTAKGPTTRTINQLVKLPTDPRVNDEPSMG